MATSNSGSSINSVKNKSDLDYLKKNIAYAILGWSLSYGYLWYIRLVWLMFYSSATEGKQGFMIKMNISNQNLDNESMTHGIAFKPKNRLEQVIF